jgi:hypothetical protein
VGSFLSSLALAAETTEQPAALQQPTSLPAGVGLSTKLEKWGKAVCEVLEAAPLIDYHVQYHGE